MQCNCQSGKLAANLKREMEQKDQAISVLSARVNAYFQRYGMLPDDEDGVPPPPNLLLDKPAGITTNESAIPPCPGVLLGAPEK